ncbi:MAG: DUF3380 domain-containing protein [Chloroflexi bacterium]|nr:DUF3380 domain-containing protein [Chloroflexota bacterium]
MSRVAAAYLVSDGTLRGVPVMPSEAARLRASPGAPAAEVAVARTWNRFGGLIESLARRVGIDPASAVGVVCVESGGEAFGADGRPTIRFESHVFRRALKPRLIPAFDQRFRISGTQPWLGHTFRPMPRAPWTAFHGSQRLEWRAYEVACDIDRDAATRSISVGLAQVMGFNHALIGYATPGEMLAAMGDDVRFQLIALFDFIAGPEGARPAVVALRRGDLERFAAIYNGAGQARHYAAPIETHIAAFRGLSQASFPKSSVPEPHRDTVRRGDTLSSIARRAGTTVAGLARTNRIEDVDRIVVGQVIVTPRPAD